MKRYPGKQPIDVERIVATKVMRKPGLPRSSNVRFFALIASSLLAAVVFTTLLVRGDIRGTQVGPLMVQNSR